MSWHSVVGTAASVAAGVVIAAGGLVREPILWLAVPPLVSVRLAMSALSHKQR